MSNRMVLVTVILQNFSFWGGLQPVTAWSWWVNVPPPNFHDKSDLSPPEYAAISANDGSFFAGLQLDWLREKLPLLDYLRGAASAPETNESRKSFGKADGPRGVVNDNLSDQYPTDSVSRWRWWIGSQEGNGSSERASLRGAPTKSSSSSTTKLGCTGSCPTASLPRI